MIQQRVEGKIWTNLWVCSLRCFKITTLARLTILSFWKCAHPSAPPAPVSRKPSARNNPWKQCCCFSNVSTIIGSILEAT
ncbi:ORF367 [White spot syndrome virus]|uniref:ORF367 n=1 Tax=White spot syndrome virus TaxID=342409 RepID=A0A2D3I639_9VIRU|nr:ORF367 [White spot syndrome virus]